MRGCLFANKENKLVEFADNVFQAYWSRGVDISQEDLLLNIANDSGLDAQDFKKFINSQRAKDILKDNTEELIKRGGFGSPTFFYNDHIFFGNDRLSLFEESFQRGLLD
jgi:2-hydroxychromene-2-carboxylate isomerase